MSEEAALKLLKQNELDHTPDSLRRLITTGHVTAHEKAGELDVDEATLRAYIQQFRKALRKAKGDLFHGLL